MDFKQQNKPLNRQLMASRKQAIGAVVGLMEGNQWQCVKLNDELRAATNAKYVRAVKTHTTKDLSDKFVVSVLTDHFDELLGDIDTADSPEAAAQKLRESIWELLKRERMHYRTSVSFSNNKPRTVETSDLVDLDDAAEQGTRLASALQAMHVSRVACSENRQLVREIKQRTEEKRAKFYDKVCSFMERTESKTQAVSSQDGREFTLKYTTARKTAPLTAVDCQNAIEAAIDTFMLTHQSHIMSHGLRGGYVARQKESILDLLVNEMKQRRSQTQKTVVRLLRKRGTGDGEDEESEGSERSGEEEYE